MKAIKDNTLITQGGKLYCMPELNPEDWSSSFQAQPASWYSYCSLRFAHTLTANEWTSVCKRGGGRERRPLTAAVREHPGFGVGVARLT